MGKFIKIFLWFSFLSTIGFAGGGYILLFLIVPFEQWLVDIGLNQRMIDRIISYIVYGWVIFGFIISFIYYQLILTKNKRVIAYLLVVFTTFNAVFVFYLFMNTGTTIISSSRGSIQEVNSRFTFGPYPEFESMKELKEKGYDGIITLLNPAIIFEKQLLEKEVNNGKEIGINVYSFPMLPWVGDNKAAIEGIKKLIVDDETKRYYVHCYLGKHRVDLAKQIIMSELGEEANTRSFLLPADFERGNIYTFENERIIIGPYPTDEEWLILFRRQVEEIVSLLPEDSNLLIEEIKIAEENGIKLTSFPLDSAKFDPEAINTIADYVKNLDHKVYIHDFNSKEDVLTLEALFQGEVNPVNLKSINDEFSGGKVHKITSWLVLGPAPTKEETAQLNNSGIRNFIQLTDNNQDYEELYELAKTLNSKKSTFYVYSTNKNILNAFYLIVNGMYNGLLEIEDLLVTKNLINGNICTVERNLLLGPALTDKEWEELILANGIERVIFLYAASIHTPTDIKQLQDLSASPHVSFKVIEMFEDYEEELIKELTSSRETTYVIAPMELQDMVFEVLTDY